MKSIYTADLSKATKENTYYALAMFPYPSGAGLHVGHGTNFTANDIIARFKRMNGYTVINPIGWDSFGLPTENYAMKLGKPASEVTAENIARYKKQCEMMDWSYDRDREVATSSPEYYKRTQWIFQELYKAGLVYKKDAFVNRCPTDQTVLANDQVVDGCCERCGTEIIQKKHPQWFIKITDYAEKLINDLDLVDRPEETKSQQRYWIGKSEGAEIDFQVASNKEQGESKKGNIIILHGKKSPETNDNDGWITWLGNTCKEMGYNALVPFVDNSRTAHGKDREKALEDNRNIINEDTILVGHSAGAATIIRWLGHNPDVKIGKVILVAPGKIPEENKTISSQTGKPVDPKDYEGIRDLYNFTIDSSIKKRVKDGIFVMTSNDKERLLASADMYITGLDAKHIVLKDRGHFNASYGNGIVNNTLKEILPIIKNTSRQNITVFTTRPDTLFGVTALVLAPENNSIDAYIPAENMGAVEEYRKATSKKTAVERQQDAETKSGVFSGVYAIHPLTNEKVPVWFADYVLPDYATGAVMFVPAHDERDWSFAKKHGLDVKQVVLPTGVDKSKIEVLFNLYAGIQEYMHARGYDTYMSGGLSIATHTGVITRKHDDLDCGFSSIDALPIFEEYIIKQGFTKVDTYKTYSTYEKNGLHIEVGAGGFSLKGMDETRDFMENDYDTAEHMLWGNTLKTYSIPFIQKAKRKLVDIRNLQKDKDDIQYIENGAYTGIGKLVNSGQFDGLENTEAKKVITEYLEKQGLGKKKVTYKLRDWSVSRQRYWGSPIPVYYTFDENEEVPYFKNTKDLLWKEGVSIDTRKNVAVIIKHWEEEKYLLIKWKNQFGVSFVTGGVDEGETLPEAAIREAQEETGYKNFVYTESVQGEVHSSFYAPHKNVNRYMIQNSIVVTLQNDERGDNKWEAHEDFDYIWATKDEVDTMLTWVNQQYQWKKYCGLPLPVTTTIERYNAHNPHPDKSKRIPHLIPTEELPVLLPLDLGNYKPQGKSPLADHATFPYYTPGLLHQHVPFFQITPRQDGALVETRSTAAAIIKHRSEDKYLFIKPGYEPTITVVMGGIEKGETAEETILREIVEETGYTQAVIQKSFVDDLHFATFHPSKKVNRYGLVSLYMCQLTGDKQQERAEGDKDLELVRCTKEEALERLSQVNKYALKKCIGENIAGEVPGYTSRYNQYNPLEPIPYFDYHDPIRGVREGVETKTRRIAQAIVKDPSTGKFLALKWKVDNAVSFVAGGIEEGEDSVACMVREISEETGYTDVTYVKHLGKYQAYFYHTLKGHNQYSFGEVLYFELNSEKKNTLAAEELEKHEPLWMTKEEFLALSNEPVNDYFIGVLEGKIPKHTTRVSAANNNVSKRALLFHGRGNTNDDSSCLLGLQKTLLQQGHALEYNTHDYEKTIAADIYSPDAHAGLVAGHSTGAYLALKYAENHKIDTLILIAPGIAKNEMPEYFKKQATKDFGAEGFVTYQEFHKDSIDNEKVKKNAKRIVFVFGKNDHIIKDEVVDYYVNNYKDVAEIIYLDRGHMGSLEKGADDIAEINALIVDKNIENKMYLRECDTLDTFMCSSFYYLRFVDPKNTKELISKELAEKALPVDFYIGGKEHTYGHLLYARFIHKFLFDRGYLNCAEPFQKLFHQGMVLGPDGRKMSKRWGNVITPEDLMNKYGQERGADVLRTYTMFMGPLEIEKAWSDTAVDGVKRFLDRVERMQEFVSEEKNDVMIQLHKTIKGVSDDIEKLKFNTAVSKMMVFVNYIYEVKKITSAQLATFLQLLAPFATRLSQEMWSKLGQEGSIHLSAWPTYDESLIAEDTLALPVQIGGKMRGTLDIKKGLSQDEIMTMVQADERFQRHLDGQTIKKIIYVQDKIVNIII